MGLGDRIAEWIAEQILASQWRAVGGEKPVLERLDTLEVPDLGELVENTQGNLSLSIHGLYLLTPECAPEQIYPGTKDLPYRGLKQFDRELLAEFGLRDNSGSGNWVSQKVRIAHRNPYIENEGSQGKYLFDFGLGQMDGVVESLSSASGIQIPNPRAFIIPLSRVLEIVAGWYLGGTKKPRITATKTVSEEVTGQYLR